MTSRYWKRCYESLKNEQFEFFVSDRFRELSFFSHSEKKRETCVCMCVQMLMFVCLKKKMRMRNVAFEKNLFSVEFKDFYLLKSILELIIRSLVNIKRKRRVYFVDRIQKFEFTFALRYKLQEVHSTRCCTRSNFRLFYFISIFCAVSAS